MAVGEGGVDEVFSGSGQIGGWVEVVLSGLW